jgi:hypothetical protein
MATGGWSVVVGGGGDGGGGQWWWSVLVSGGTRWWWLSLCQIKFQDSQIKHVFITCEIVTCK